VIVIGIVGRIGAGKSTVAAAFARHGARVIDADRIAHGVLAEPAVIDDVVARFGPRVLAAEGGAERRIDRGALGGIVFGPSPEQALALRDLEAIVHPRVHDRIEGMLDQARAEARRSGAGEGNAVPAVVLDVPLLVQAGWVDACDVVVVLECDDAVRRGRIAARFSPEQILARESAWARSLPHPLPPGKIRTVDTSGDPAYTLSQIDRIWADLRSQGST